MSYQIADLNYWQFTIDDGIRTWTVPKFRNIRSVSEPYFTITWTDKEVGTADRRSLTLDYNDVLFGIYAPSSAAEVNTLVLALINKAWDDIIGQLGNYVPYIGATGSVDLGIYGMTTDFLAFSQTPTTGPGPAQIGYNGATLGLAYDFDTTNVRCVIGQQMFAYVKNDEAVTITKGQAVYLFGASGNKATVKLALNTSDATSATSLGLAAEDIASGQNGLVITQGVLDGIDTSAYSPGNILYVGATAGSWTSVKPYAPAHLVYIGVVEKSNAGNGQIYVRMQNGYELDEIHDVDLITTPPSTGDVLTYNGTLWVNQAPASGSGTVTSIATTSPITGGTITTSGTIGINNAAADGSTKGAAAFTASDFNDNGSGVISIDYTNGQAASGSNKGFLTSADWTTFNSKFTLPALTSGSVLFSNGTTIAQDNANLFWDDSNNRLGIGTNAPAYNLDINGTCRITSTLSNGLLIEGTNPYTPGTDYITINGTGNTGITLKTNTSGFCAHRFFVGSTELGVFYAGETNREFVFKNSSTGFIDFQTTNLGTSRLRILNNGRVLINTITDGGFQFDVNGTGRIAGDTTISGNITATKSQNANSRIEIINSTAGTASLAELKATSNANNSFQFGKTSTSYTTYKTLVAGDGYIYNNGNAGSISILNDFATGTIKFTAGGSSTVHWTINSNGNLEANNAINMVFGTTTGTKIGTATSQKIGFWNATPIVQPTTAVAAATFAAVAGGSTIDTNDTFDGYTVGQVVKALRNLGILA